METITVLKNPTILCLDDEAIILSSLRLELAQALDTAIAIEVCSNGKEALSLLNELILEESDVPLIISDQVMPGMSGDEFLSQAHELSPKSHLVLLTGYSNIDAIKKAINNAGLYRFISKPWDPNYIKSTAQGALREYSHEKIIHLQHAQIEKISLAMITSLEAANMTYDHDTGSHVRRVAHVTALLAQWCGHDQAYVDRIKNLSRLHDIGKIGVACQLINKNGRYTGEEFDIMKRHVTWGGRILANEAIDSMARNIAVYHHERWDGSGYMKGLKGEKIPLEARLVAVADVLDALVSQRPYKGAIEPEKAVETLISGRGSHFDPEIIDILQDHVQELVLLYANNSWRYEDSDREEPPLMSDLVTENSR